METQIFYFPLFAVEARSIISCGKVHLQNCSTSKTKAGTKKPINSYHYLTQRQVGMKRKTDTVGACTNFTDSFSCLFLLFPQATLSPGSSQPISTNHLSATPLFSAACASSPLRHTLLFPRPPPGARARGPGPWPRATACLPAYSGAAPLTGTFVAVARPAVGAIARP